MDKAEKPNRQNDNRYKKLFEKGTECSIIFKPCCFKLEKALADGKIIVFFNKTIFDENNVITRPQTQAPAFKSNGSFLTHKECPFCEAPMTINKDLSGTVTYYGVGLKEADEVE